MPTIRGSTTAIPIVHSAAVLSFSSSPTGTFAPDLEFELLQCDASASANDLPSLAFRRRTGSVKHPHEAAFSNKARDPRRLGTWVELKFSGPTGLSAAQFLGVIVQAKSVLFGSDVLDTGQQQWTAVGALHLLRHISVSSAFWVESAQLIESERVPSFNGRDEMGTLVGNRSAAIEGLSFVFGGTATWTRRQAVDYLLARFANPGGLTWTVAGDTELIDVATDTIEMGQTGTVANAVRRILSPSFGLDFTVERTPLGFELRVFSLASQAVTYGGVTIPKNPRRIKVEPGVAPDLERVEFTRAFDNRYSRIRVKGSRIIVVFTLDAALGHLIPKWSAANETAYKDGTGDPLDNADDHDTARQRPDLQNVYTTFGAPNPFALADVAAAIELSAEGILSATDGLHPSSWRSTLRWTPLREGFDYSSGDPVDNGLAGHEADLQRPLAWIVDERTGRFVQAEAAGFSVSVPRNDWGIVLIGDYPHLLADGRFAGAAASICAPEYDADKIVATIAARLDTRLSLEHELEDGADDGTVLEISMPGAEYWIVAPGSVVGVDGAGALQVAGESIILRDDTARMAATMAAAISRYLRTRARATITLRGYHPWAALVGSILTVVEQFGADEDIGAPITSVSFQAGDRPMTTIRAGYE